MSGEKIVVQNVPLIGVSMAFDCFDGRGITIQHHIERDMPIDQQDDLLDRLWAIGERKRATYELPMLEEKLREIEQGYEQMCNNAEILDKDHEKNMLAASADIENMQKERDEIFQKGYAEHVSTGRQGAYKPKGAAEGRIGNLTAALEKAHEQSDKLKNQHAMDVKNFATNKKVWENKIEEARAKVLASQKLLEG